MILDEAFNEDDEKKKQLLTDTDERDIKVDLYD